MNLLVTGGAGFIGSHFVLRHVEAHPKDRVVVLDLLTYAADQSYLRPVEKKITFIRGDIANESNVSNVIDDNGIDTIVNFAAESHVDNSIADAAPFLHTNVIGTQSLINVLKDHSDVRLLHVSTDEVYGDVEDDDPLCTVAYPLTPSSPYAASKAAAEMLLMAAMRTYAMKICISRCTNNYGPHQADEKFMPTVIRSALRGEPVPIYGEGLNKRDWLYVSDHCDALELLLNTLWAFDDELPIPGGKKQKGGGHIFNVAAEDEKRNIDVAKMILKILRKPESLLKFVPDRPGHDWRYAVDAAQTRKLGWKPNVNFEEGLEKTVDWFRLKYGV